MEKPRGDLSPLTRKDNIKANLKESTFV